MESPEGKSKRDRLEGGTNLVSGFLSGRKRKANWEAIGRCHFREKPSIIPSISCRQHEYCVELKYLQSQGGSR